MIEIPDLANTGFEEVSFRLTFDPQNLVDTCGADFIADSSWALDGVDLQGKNDASTLVAHLTGGPDQEEGLESGLAVELMLRQRSGFALRADGKATFEEISAALDELNGATAYAVVLARYSVKRSQLPPQGLVNGMLGVKTLAGGEELLLSGASFFIRGFRNDSVSWFVSPHDAAETISGTISRETYEPLHERLLSDAVYLAQSRLSRLILEEVHHGRSPTDS